MSNNHEDAFILTSGRIDFEGEIFEYYARVRAPKDRDEFRGKLTSEYINIDMLEIQFSELNKVDDDGSVRQVMINPDDPGDVALIDAISESVMRQFIH